MFEHLAEYKKILVTGPHRSGTTIAAAMIAQDTKHLLVLEELSWRPSQNLDMLEFWLRECKWPVVCQAPYAADACHHWPEVFVVFMVRDVNKIAASKARAKLSDGTPVNFQRMQTIECNKYSVDGNFYGSAPDAELKYSMWEEQKARIKNYLELPYEELSKHPLWLSDRTGFHVRQIA